MSSTAALSTFATFWSAVSKHCSTSGSTGSSSGSPNTSCSSTEEPTSLGNTRPLQLISTPQHVSNAAAWRSRRWNSAAD
eukprot:19094-Heterococcus_DN1.PRE.2